MSVTREELLNFEESVLNEMKEILAASGGGETTLLIENGSSTATYNSFGTGKTITIANLGDSDIEVEVGSFLLGAFIVPAGVTLSNLKFSDFTSVTVTATTTAFIIMISG